MAESIITLGIGATPADITPFILSGLTAAGEVVFTPIATNLRIVAPSLTLTAGAALQVPFLTNEAGAILTMEGDMPLISEGQTAKLRIVRPSLSLREV